MSIQRSRWTLVTKSKINFLPALSPESKKAFQREFFPIPLRARLPVVPIPLRPADADVALELQPVIDQCYQRGRYSAIDYRQEVAPPLAAADARWMDELLRERRLTK